MVNNSSEKTNESALELGALNLRLSNATKTILAGGIAGVVSKTATAPLSRLAILYQINAFAALSRDSILTSSWNLYREEGLLSFWRGNLTSCIHRFPYSAINFSVFAALQTLAFERLNIEDSSSMRLVCGAISGAVACSACYPLDLVRTRLTVQSSGYYRGIGDCLRRIVQEEGVGGLYKGLGVSLLVCVPSLAISFSVYGTCKHWLQASAQGTVLVDPSTRCINAYGNCVAGAFAGITSSVTLFPLDVLRRRLQVRSGHPRRSGMRHVWSVMRAEGLRGMYRGIVPEVLKVTPMVGIQFTIYETLIRQMGGLKKHH